MKKHVFIFLFLFSEVARAGAGAGGNPGSWAGNPLDYFVHYEVEVIKSADGTCNRKIFKLEKPKNSSPYEYVFKRSAGSLDQSSKLNSRNSKVCSQLVTGKKTCFFRIDSWTHDAFGYPEYWGGSCYTNEGSCVTNQFIEYNLGNSKGTGDMCYKF